ncbi:MAG TPA: pyrimidine dimer DNA glycosylase/endonuclease V [Thermoanaerobaculia bacterium]|nr:pyrimidine dimer DNA glycosylase/endonuclease V [Thermoanaerobaculia bacterium]
MRLWSLHPQYLDSKGLVALWREALLAQAVLLGLTRGYTRHPQLERFREAPDSRALIAAYLREVASEAGRRGYRFDQSKIIAEGDAGLITVSDAQLHFEWRHLQSKLSLRDPDRYERHQRIDEPLPHPMFTVIAGPIASWERDGGQKKRSVR